MASLIVGYGEVGKALATIIGRVDGNTWVHDPAQKMFAPDQDYDVMHICYGYDRQFVNGVKMYMKSFKPKLTIIHSTVEVGTTRRIGGRIAYSPVRGRHQEGLIEMTQHPKHIGAEDFNDLEEAKKYLKDMGFNVSICYDNPDAVELQKLQDTTYYGICIAATKMFKQMADHYGVEWQALADGNMTYNMGSQLVGHPEWIRPELQPMEGPIGGHCVVQNTKILQKTFVHPLLEAIETAGEPIRKTYEDD